MLTRQYVEKDALLKFVMRKYLQLGVIEATSIKEHFRVDVESLVEMKAQMGDDLYQQVLKQLKLDEENLLKRTDLQMQTAYAEEEARVRKELDKKHMQEQIELKINISTRQAQMRLEIIGQSMLNDTEQDLERKAFERFQVLKQQEQDRRIRATELQKKTLTAQVD